MAAACAVGYHSSAVAGPIPASMASLSSVIPSDAVDVRYHRRGHGRFSYHQRYYHHPYYYDRGYYYPSHFSYYYYYPNYYFPYHY
jgi:hypothetical protein